MLVWDEAVDLCGWLATDTGTETTTNAKLLMNFGYKQILARFRRDQNSDTQTASTVASQRAYMLPPNFLRFISASFTYGSVLTPIEHIQDETIWQRFTSYTQTTARPTRCYIRTRFGAGGSEILLDPVPSVVGTLEIKYEATDRKLQYTKYTTGTVTITPGSTVITGAGTTFTNAMIGRYFNVTTEAGEDGWWYRIGSYTSATVIGLEQMYEGNGSGALATQSYQIAEAFALPEEMQILPVYYFLQHYYSKLQNEKKTAEYLGLYNGIFNQAKLDYNSKDDNAKVFNASKYGAGAWPVWPGHFPQSVTE